MYNKVWFSWVYNEYHFDTTCLNKACQILNTEAFFNYMCQQPYLFIFL